MSDDYFRIMAEMAVKDSEGLTETQLVRQVTLILKEVERTARQKATSMAYDLAASINSMQYGE